MSRIDIISITGTSPFEVYVSDFYGNNKTYLGTIDSSVPPTEFFYPPAIFDYAPGIMVIIKDSNNCEMFKYLECRTGCGFQIIISNII